MTVTWFEHNRVPPLSIPDLRTTCLRDWHPDFGLGDAVQRRWLGSDAVGTVVSFGRRGVHLVATVKFPGREETFVASEYVSVRNSAASEVPREARREAGLSPRMEDNTKSCNPGERWRGAMSDIPKLETETLVAIAALNKREAERLRAENERLTGLVACLLYNDPDDMAADGVTVLEVWRKDAKRALSPGPVA